MWFIRNFVWLVILVVVGWFGSENWKETVTAIHLPGHVYHDLSANIVLLLTFALGTATGLCLTLFQHLKIRSTVSRVNRENQDLKRELDQLRNLPLEDLRLGEESGATRG
jgi:uncharacterized membrane protein YciS (DUF1049 family)